MSRKAPVAGPTISLFPFLAVLLCTMGALLVLLVLFSRSAKQGETAEAVREREELVQELELARDSLAWRREQLATVRERTAEDLAKARMQLAGVEENTRALQDELTKLERTAAALASQAGAVAADEETLRALEARLTSSRESLDKARASRDSKPPAYAVVPYEGRHGTHRRPLYIECCGDGVFLQPEGIRLSPGDFEGPPGPGNPLASALRAAREHIVAGQGGTSDPAAQPYPLLLVRPSGVMAYYAAREAIQSWGSDFGYQLIDEDWTLTFPPADPLLAQVEKRAIDESRARLAWLAEVRPARPAKPTRQYRAAQTRGGVVADGGPSVLGDQSRWDWANNQQAGGVPAGSGSGTGSGSGSGAGGDGAGDGVSGSRRGSMARGNTAGTGNSGGFDGSDPVGGDVILGGGAGGAERGQTGGPGGAAGGGKADAALVGNRYSGSSQFAGRAGAGAGGGAPAGSLAEAGPGAGSTAGAGAGMAGSGASSGAGGSGAAGGRFAAQAGSSAGSSGGTDQGGGGAAGGGSGPAMPGLVQAGGGAAAGQAGAAGSASASVSLAQSRGRNWASLATQDRPIPLTRPIRLECSLHEFRLLDDTGRRVETRIPVPADTAAAIDPLVAAVNARVNRWGIAGERMYWKPQLVLSETADGRSRREDLERLLADSGLDTRSSDGRDEIRPLPPIERAASFVPAR